MVVPKVQEKDRKGGFGLSQSQPPPENGHAPAADAASVGMAKPEAVPVPIQETEADAAIRVLAQRLGMSPDVLKTSIGDGLTAAIESATKRFESVRSAIVEAVGGYREFHTITVSHAPDGTLVVDRATGVKAKGGGGYAGSGQSFRGQPVTVPPALSQKYKLSSTAFSSRRQLAIVLKEATGHGAWDKTDDNRTWAKVREYAPDIHAALGSPKD